MKPAPLDRRTFLAGACAIAAASLLPSPLISPAHAGDSPLLRAQRLAWAGVRLQLGPSDVYLDPLLNPKAWGPALPDRLVPIDPPGEGSRYVLVTHRHPDHFDPIAIGQALGETGALVCTADAVAAATSAGFRVRLASLYEPLLLGDFLPGGTRVRRLWRSAGVLGSERRRAPHHPWRGYLVARRVVVDRPPVRAVRRGVPADQRRALRLAQTGQRRARGAHAATSRCRGGNFECTIAGADPLRHHGVGRIHRNRPARSDPA